MFYKPNPLVKYFSFIEDHIEANLFVLKLFDDMSFQQITRICSEFPNWKISIFLYSTEKPICCSLTTDNRATNGYKHNRRYWYSTPTSVKIVFSLSKTWSTTKLKAFCQNTWHNSFAGDHKQCLLSTATKSQISRIVFISQKIAVILTIRTRTDLKSETCKAQHLDSLHPRLKTNKLPYSLRLYCIKTNTLHILHRKSAKEFSSKILYK